jgi:hypothetical protein
MFIPDFCPSQIPDLESRIQKLQERGGINLLSYLFCSNKYHKIENYFIFELIGEQPKKRPKLASSSNGPRTCSKRLKTNPEHAVGEEKKFGPFYKEL